MLNSPAIQQLMNQAQANPEMMQNMMSSPYVQDMMQSMSSNPQLMEQVRNIHIDWFYFLYLSFNSACSKPTSF